MSLDPWEDTGRCTHGQLPRECEHSACPHWDGKGTKVEQLPSAWVTRHQWLFPDRRGPAHANKRFDQVDSTRVFNTAQYWLLYIGDELVCEVPNCEVP